MCLTKAPTSRRFALRFEAQAANWCFLGSALKVRASRRLCGSSRLCERSEAIQPWCHWIAALRSQRRFRQSALRSRAIFDQKSEKMFRAEPQRRNHRGRRGVSPSSRLNLVPASDQHTEVNIKSERNPSAFSAPPRPLREPLFLFPIFSVPRERYFICDHRACKGRGS